MEKTGAADASRDRRPAPLGDRPGAALSQRRTDPEGELPERLEGSENALEA